MSGEQERILVVDDDVHVRKVITNILRSGGYRVDTADDGAAALTAIRLSRPDLVLLDAVMPVLDGFAVLRALRASPDPPPVAGITAISDHEAFARFLSSGAVAYVCKPIAMRHLLQVVQQAIEGRRRRGPRKGSTRWPGRSAPRRPRAPRRGAAPRATAIGSLGALPPTRGAWSMVPLTAACRPSFSRFGLEFATTTPDLTPAPACARCEAPTNHNGALPELTHLRPVVELRHPLCAGLLSAHLRSVRLRLAAGSGFRLAGASRSTSTSLSGPRASYAVRAISAAGMFFSAQLRNP